MGNSLLAVRVINHKYIVVERRLCGNPGSRKEHYSDHRQRDDRQRYVQYEHADKRSQNGYAGIDDLRDSLTHQLSEGVNVVRINRHDIPVSVSIKIPDGQRFHMLKQVRCGDCA